MRAQSRSFFARLCLAGPALVLVGCAGAYQSTAIKSWDLLRTGQTEQALETYSEKVKRPEDTLLKLMDEGILLRAAGKFSESNAKFFEAARIIEMNGYVDAAETAVTLISNEEQSRYQGEDFEKILVHLYLGLNFLELKDEESALIETRKVNEIISVMIQKGNRPYEFNAFARYLGALLFENAGDVNDALVALRATMKLTKSMNEKNESLQIDLLRLAERMDFETELIEWRKDFGETISERAHAAVKQKQGAISLLFEAGASPMKYSSKEYHAKTGKGGTLVEIMIPVAHYKTRSSQVQRARMRIEPKDSVSTRILNDIESTAIQHLNDRMGRQIAKALLTAGVKAGVGVAVGAATNNKDLGTLTALTLMLLSEADTRSWMLLPQTLQMARIFLNPGTYDVEIDYLTSKGEVFRTERLSGFKVRPFRTTFIQRRSFD